MPIDRWLWTHGFHADKVPEWPCPCCGHATLQNMMHTVHVGGKLHEKSAIVEYESRHSRIANLPSDDEFDGVFGAVLKCSRHDCGEAVALTGTTCFDLGDFGERVTYYEPKYFEPPLPLFQIPPKCPQSIAIEVNAAFALYWADPSACINCIRCAVERFLDHADIKRSRVVQQGGKRRKQVVVLHQRIEVYKAKQPQIAKQLLAIKWLGNAGSHERKITKEDALEGFEILKWVLNQRFDLDAKQVAKMATAINRRKGPVSKKRKPKK